MGTSFIKSNNARLATTSIDNQKPHLNSRPSTLSDYATARFRFAGSSLLEHRDPFFSSIEKRHAELQAGGKSCLSFAHYDYLGLAGDSRILSAAQTALMTHGTGVSASRIVGGERGIHGELEHEIASFLRVDAALVLISGYLTNSTIIGHLLGARDIVICDELSHNSILHGIAASKADHATFAHNDMNDLERVLEAVRGSHHRCLIVAEGLYSMDGDIVDLPRLIELKHKYDCWLMIDDAHAIGVLGESGRGTAEHYGVDPHEIDLLIGTLSKSLVSTGGYIAGDAAVVRMLKYTLPGFVYSVGISPVETGAALQSLKILQSEPERVRRVQTLSNFFAVEARRRGINIGGAVGRGIIPVMFANVPEALAMSEILFEAGIYAPPIVRIGVPRDKPRLRFFVSAAHTENDVVRVLDALAAGFSKLAQSELQTTDA